MGICLDQQVDAHSQLPTADVASYDIGNVGSIPTIGPFNQNDFKFPF
jgi:hypothetical protein